MHLPVITAINAKQLIYIRSKVLVIIAKVWLLAQCLSSYPCWQRARWLFLDVRDMLLVTRDLSAKINKKIFGIDLIEAGLDKLVINYLCRMTAGKGAVRKTLQEAL